MAMRIVPNVAPSALALNESMKNSSNLLTNIDFSAELLGVQEALADSVAEAANEKAVSEIEVASDQNNPENLQNLPSGVTASTLLPANIAPVPVAAWRLSDLPSRLDTAVDVVAPTGMKATKSSLSDLPAKLDAAVDVVAPTGMKATKSTPITSVPLAASGNQPGIAGGAGLALSLTPDVVVEKIAIAPRFPKSHPLKQDEASKSLSALPSIEWQDALPSTFRQGADLDSKETEATPVSPGFMASGTARPLDSKTEMHRFDREMTVAVSAWASEMDLTHRATTQTSLLTNVKAQDLTGLDTQATMTGGGGAVQSSDGLTNVNAPLVSFVVNTEDSLSKGDPSSVALVANSSRTDEVMATVPLPPSAFPQAEPDISGKAAPTVARPTQDTSLESSVSDFRTPVDPGSLQNARTDWRPLSPSASSLPLSSTGVATRDLGLKPLAKAVVVDAEPATEPTTAPARFDDMKKSRSGFGEKATSILEKPLVGSAAARNDIDREPQQEAMQDALSIIPIESHHDTSSEGRRKTLSTLIGAMPASDNLFSSFKNTEFTVESNIKLPPHQVRFDFPDLASRLLSLSKSGGGEIRIDVTPPDESSFKITLRIIDAKEVLLVVTGASDSTRTRLDNSVDQLQQQFSQMGMSLNLGFDQPSSGQPQLAARDHSGNGGAWAPSTLHRPESNVDLPAAVGEAQEPGAVNLYA